MRENPKPYEIYRHFKGNLYQILAIATDSEDGTRKVVYQALYEPFGIFVRDLELFMGPVDHAKYPDAKQGNRFELITGRTLAVPMQRVENKSKSESDTETIKVNTDRQETAVQEGNAAIARQASEEALDPQLLKFLDADTYEEKLNILVSMHDRINQDMINTMAMALDIEVAPGALEERYEQIKNCILTFEKYECNRLR